MSNQCYHNGDFWQCVTATNAGESPTTHAAKWRKLKLPSKWRWVLAQLTYAALLVMDGQNDKANVARSVAYGRDRVGLDELIRAEANEEQKSNRCGQRGRGAIVNTGATRPVAASVILDDAYRLIGWDQAQLDDREKTDARMALSQAVQEVWEAWWWHELMVCEQMPLARPLLPGEIAPAFDATYNGNVFYWALTDEYFFLSGDVNTEDPTDAAGNLTGSPATWVKLDLQGRYEPWAADTTYTIYEDASRVTWAGKQYAMIGAGTSIGEDPRQGGPWVELPATFGLLPYWDYSYSTAPAIVGQVAPFGPIRSVSKYDPRATNNPNFYELDVTAAGTRVLGLDVGLPWVWSRRVTPIITGDAFDATATYEATEPEDLVYDA